MNNTLYCKSFEVEKFCGSTGKRKSFPGNYRWCPCAMHKTTMQLQMFSSELQFISSAAKLLPQTIRNIHGIFTSHFKAFTMFSLISDLTGHNSIMFNEISHYTWFLHGMCPTMMSPFMTLTVYKSSRLPLFCLHGRILPVSSI